MEILVSVDGQKMKITSDLKCIAPKSKQFVSFRFSFSDDWDGLTVFAQFRQGDNAYNQYLDSINSVYMPQEISGGICTLMLYGTGDNVIATTNYLKLVMTEDVFVEDAESVDITESLYEQLVKKVSALAGQDISEIFVTTPDTALSSTSTNPVQNKVVYNAIYSLNDDVSAVDERIDELTLGQIDDTYDYVKMTAEERTKLSGIATGANKTTVDTALSSTSTNPVQNKVIYSALASKASTSVATTSDNGLMSASDKTKLNGIATGANKTTVDTALSSTSTNPVQNKIVYNALTQKLNTSGGTITGEFKVSSGGEQLFSVNNSDSNEIYVNTDMHIDNDVDIYWGKGMRLSNNKFIIPPVIRPVKTDNDAGDPQDFFFQDSAGVTMIHFNYDSPNSKLNIGLINDDKYIQFNNDAIAAYHPSQIKCITDLGDCINIKSNQVHFRYDGNSKLTLNSKGCLLNGKIYMNKVDETAGITTVNGYSTDEISYLNTYSIQEILIDLQRNKVDTDALGAAATREVSTDINTTDTDDLITVSGVIEAITKLQKSIVIDTALSSTSTNPVQNKVVYNAIYSLNDDVSAVDERIDELTLGQIDDTYDYVKMTAEERTKLSGIATGANKTTVDTALSDSSTNPVQNKVVWSQFEDLWDFASGLDDSITNLSQKKFDKSGGTITGATTFNENISIGSNHILGGATLNKDIDFDSEELALGIRTDGTSSAWQNKISFEGVGDIDIYANGNLDTYVADSIHTLSGNTICNTAVDGVTIAAGYSGDSTSAESASSEIDNAISITDCNVDDWDNFSNTLGNTGSMTISSGDFVNLVSGDGIRLISKSKNRMRANSFERVSGIDAEIYKEEIGDGQYTYRSTSSGEYLVSSGGDMYFVPGNSDSASNKPDGTHYFKVSNIKGTGGGPDGQKKPIISNFSDIRSQQFTENGVVLEDKYIKQDDISDLVYTINGGLKEDGIPLTATSTAYICNNGNTYIKAATNTTYDGDTLASNTDIVNLYVDNDVTDLYLNAEYCTNLSTVVIPDNVTINKGYNLNFQGCYNLRIARLPNTLTEILDLAFSDCVNLTNITIPDSVTFINTEAFYNCTNLHRINIPYSVTTIDEIAFYGCTGLNTVTIGSSTDGCNTYSIDETAFDGCDNLKTITIYSVEDFISGAPWGATNATVKWAAKILQQGAAGENATAYLCQDGSCFVTGSGDMANDGYMASINSEFKAAAEKAVISDGITSICASAFAGYKKLINVIIPSSVTSIGNYAFYYCTSLTSITIPASVTSIGEKAFGGCTNLTAITINKAEDSIEGAPWGATNATVVWNG